MRTVAAILLTALLVLSGGCNDGNKPDPFNGCGQHPGECGRTK